MTADLLTLPAGAIPAGATKTVTLTAYELERLANLTRLYDAALAAPAPSMFVDTIQWAHQRQAAQCELARFTRELFKKREIA